MRTRSKEWCVWAWLCYFPPKILCSSLFEQSFHGGLQIKTVFFFRVDLFVCSFVRPKMGMRAFDRLFFPFSLCCDHCSKFQVVERRKKKWKFSGRPTGVNKMRKHTMLSVCTLMKHFEPDAQMHLHFDLRRILSCMNYSCSDFCLLSHFLYQQFNYLEWWCIQLWVVSG